MITAVGYCLQKYLKKFRSCFANPVTFTLTVYPSPNLFTRCWQLPRHLKCPLTIIANRVQRASHSSMLCEVNITLCPLLTTLLIRSHRNLLAIGSIPEVGSSNNTTFGLPSNA